MIRVEEDIHHSRVWTNPYLPHVFLLNRGAAFTPSVLSVLL